MLNTLIKSSRNKAVLNQLEICITILLILYFSEGIALVGSLNRILAVMSYPLLFCLTIRLLQISPRRFIFVLSRDVWIIGLVLLAAASLVWTDDVSSTLATSRALIRNTLFGVYLATRFSLKDILNLLVISLGIASIVSLLTVLLTPGVGIASDGSWKGAFAHKNILARTMVINVLIFLSLQVEGKLRYLKWAGAGIAIALLILSRGKTALLLLFIALSLWPLCQSISRRDYKSQITLLSVQVPTFIIITYLAIASIETIVVDFLGKDLTLTGRTQLWAELIKLAFEKPWFGYGYFGFWESNRDKLEARVEHGWVPTHAHSGFLELVLFLGIMGLVLFSISFFKCYFKSIKIMIGKSSPQFFWPFLFLTVMFLSNVNVGLTIISPVSLVWSLYVAISLAVSMPSNLPTFSMSKKSKKTEKLEISPAYPNPYINRK